MIYTSELIQKIITSVSAKKALTYISPIYADAEYFLRILNAIGSQLDVVWNFGQDMWSDIVPQETSKLIKYWETAYGISHDSSKSLVDRQSVLVQKIRSNPPMNPRKLEDLLSTVPGVFARVEENTGKNKFTVWIDSDEDKTSELKKIIDKAKPAHLTYELKKETVIDGNVYVGIIAMTGKEITIRMVN